MLAKLLSKVFGGSLGRVLADASARVWVGFLSFALLPTYLKFIGAESFGVLSAFASIQAIIALFDCSMAPSLTRELARARGTNTEWDRIKDLAKTMEVIYWTLALLAGLIFYFLVPLISHHWLNPEKMSADQIRSSLYIAAIALTVQWPSTLYSGGLVGLEKQRMLATISFISSTLRAVISIFCLWYFAPTVQTLFYVAVGFGGTQTLIMRYLFWSNIPTKNKGVFRANLLSDVWKFAVGVSIVTLSSVLLLQTDKIVLSKLLKLENFGYYTISVSIANALFIVTGSIFSVIFPKFSELVAAKKMDRLISFYHLACQGVVVAILPVSAVIAFYSGQFLFLWTKNPAVAEQGHLILSVFILGNVCNCLMSVPYTVMLGFGLTRVSVMANIVSIFVAFPLIYFLFQHVGTLAGPITWLVVNFGLMATSAYVVHTRFLKGEAKRWLGADTIVPALVSFGTVLLFRTFVPLYENKYQIIATVGVAWICASLLTITALPALRTRLFEILRR